MRRFVLALVASLGLTSAVSLGAAGSTQGTWTVFDYNPSGQALAPRVSAASMPATTSGNTTSFQFQAGTFTALLTTNDSALTGDLSTRTLNDTVSVSGASATFTAQNGDGCPAPANVRFYVVSASASGPSTGTPPAGFYTQFWWSNPANVPLLSGSQPAATISASLADPSKWSDWNGQRADNPAVTEGFIEATKHVQTVGLSFGGGCFFENGVTTSNNPETFFSTFTES